MGFGEYNRDQIISFRAIKAILEDLPTAEATWLKSKISSYLNFRKATDNFYRQYFEPVCQKSCFETHISACCGFESIIIFFADQAINCLMSRPDQIVNILNTLEQPNRSSNCVFLGETGCIWQVRPIACAMFFCEQAKNKIFDRHPEAEVTWQNLQEQEKGYTWPTTPVLFDEIEKYFIELGVDSPSLYFHKSPGLLRLKAKAAMSTSDKHE